MFDHLLKNPEGNPFGPDQGAVFAEPASSAGQQAERRAQWALALKGATLFTAMAVQARDWAKARQGEELIANASRLGGVDSALLTAIFGGEVPALDLSNRLMAACYEAGQTASDKDVATARELVRVNKAGREAAAQNRRIAERAADQAAYAAKKAAEKAAWDAGAPQRKAAADKAAAEKLAAQAAAAEKAAAAKDAAKAETDAAVSKITATASVGYSGALYLTQEQVWAVRSPWLRTEGAFPYGQTYARVEVAEGYGSMVLRLLPEGNAKHDLACAKALADGGIEVDGVILCDDGSEIVI